MSLQSTICTPTPWVFTNTQATNFSFIDYSGGLLDKRPTLVFTENAMSIPYFALTDYTKAISFSFIGSAPLICASRWSVFQLGLQARLVARAALFGVAWYGSGNELLR